MGPRGEPGRAAPADQFGDEDHVDLAGLRQRQDLLHPTEWIGTSMNCAHSRNCVTGCAPEISG